MRPLENKHALSGVGDFHFLMTLAWVVAAVILFVPCAQSQTLPAITNLAGLTQVFISDTQVVRDVSLDAAVFACNTNCGVMILQDASGAELLELDGLNSQFAPGDQVRIESSSCLLDPSDIGIYMSTAPLVDDDGLHKARQVSSLGTFKAGRHPLRLDWFNQFSGFELEVSCVATNPGELRSAKQTANSTALLRTHRAQCFYGYWSRLPDFHLLPPVKTGRTTNFDIGFRTRDDMVGIRFDGYFDAPQTGSYLFTLNSDDGSRLWIGDPAVPVTKVGVTLPPRAPLAYSGEPMASPSERRLVTLEGRVRFVSRAGKGLRFEMRSEQNAVSVLMADAGPLNPGDLLNAYVRVSGIAEGILTENQRVIMGRLVIADPHQIAFIEPAPGKGIAPTVLKTVLQIHSLSSQDAARQLPVAISGVVTAVGHPLDRWMAIQDDTRGTFVRLIEVSNCVPRVGELWRITGHTEPGDFAPIIAAEKAAFLGLGRPPPPAHPTWNQLVNGSMDVQWVELQGLVTGVQSNRLSLLLPEGHQEIRLPEWGEAELKPFDKAVVRLRGALFAEWNATNHEVLSGGVTMHNVSISVDKPAPVDPFAAREKTPRGLFLFDAKATPFERVKVRGQVTYVDSTRIFLEEGSGIQVIPAADVNVQAGDWVEAVGFPEISGVSPTLREALVRKTSAGVLPAARLVSDAELVDECFAASRVRIQGNLAGRRMEEDSLVLQIQTRSHIFLARVANAASLRSLRLGSKLSLTGIYVSGGRDGLPTSGASQFELLLNRPGDVAVLSEPSWWTLQRLLSVVAMLLISLALAAVWIALLRRQVAQRTLQLQHEMRERERAERQHALESERSRIARDLHDDLGSSLTEINVLASTGQRPRPDGGAHPALFKAIADKARTLVAALDVIVWAVDPEDNSLQSLADYLSGYTREYLANSSIVCRFKVPIKFPNATLDGQIRHEVLMILKETLNNIVRHADATEVEFQMNITGGILEISVADNGKGFDPNAECGGHGLKNRSARLAKIGGSCHLESRAGVGTTVHIRLPVLAGKPNSTPEFHTTFD